MQGVVRVQCSGKSLRFIGEALKLSAPWLHSAVYAETQTQTPSPKRS